MRENKARTTPRAATVTPKMIEAGANRLREYSPDYETPEIAVREIYAVMVMASRPPMTVIDEIAEERRRQIEKEGWTEAHDDEHDNCQMARAAAAYAAQAAMDAYPAPQDYTYKLRLETIIKNLWPWASEWWKPKDARRDLIRAAALIVAEIERLDREPEYDAKRFAWTYTGDGRSA